jgi:hypothetical protein
MSQGVDDKVRTSLTIVMEKRANIYIDKFLQIHIDRKIVERLLLAETSIENHLYDRLCVR